MASPYCGLPSAHHKERQENTARSRLVALEIDVDDADASDYELVWQADRRIGFVTPGGFGHCVGKSLALASVEKVTVSNDKSLEVHVVGKRFEARIIENSPWGPEGVHMRV